MVLGEERTQTRELKKSIKNTDGVERVLIGEWGACIFFADLKGRTFRIF